MSAYEKKDLSVMDVEIQELSNGLFYFIGYNNYNDCGLVKSDKKEDIDKNIFYSKCVSLDVDELNIDDGILASNEVINVNAKNITGDNISIIYSKNSDINIICDNIQFNGLIYAPNGKVNIESNNGSINGRVICREKVLDDSVLINEDKNVSKLISFLEKYKNEGYMRYDAYFDENGLNVYCDSSLPMYKGKIYTRKDDKKEFTVLIEFDENEGVVKDYDFDRNLDVIVEGETVFGEKIESKLISFIKNDEGKPERIKVDSDNDGVEDGIEIFYLKSDPNNKDSDGDGIDDGKECYLLGTNPIEQNNPMDDFDKDGVVNIDEIKKSTNPFLEDSDFDGINDLNDNEPVSYIYDTDMEMYYLQTRFYDPIIKRFISTDKAYMLICEEDNYNLYAYCKNNPIRCLDGDGKAVKMSIFSLPEWKIESENCITDLQYYYNWYYKENVNGKVQYPMIYECEKYWNNLSGESLVIINTHGDPIQLQGSGCITCNDVSMKFDYKKISLVVLLGCNNGHYNYINIARYFANSISGQVLASDGTVCSQCELAKKGEEPFFISDADSTFQAYCKLADDEGRENYGWLGYQSRVNGSTIIYDYGIEVLTMFHVFYILEEL